MFKKITLSVLFSICISTMMWSQVGIGTTDPKAMLDIQSSDNGILIPRVALTETSDQSPISAPTPEIGLMVFNTATINDVTPGFYYWNGTTWERMGSGDSTAWALTGNAGTNPGTAAGENFIGTSDNVNFIIGTNGSERFNFTNNGRLRAYGNGSEGQPTFSWNGDTNTGMWRPNADNLAFSTNGAERMRISTNGNVGVNTSNPIYKLHLSNNAENIGATTLIGSINEGNDGVSFLGNNTNVLNNYNGIEGGTSYSLNTSMTAAIFGLAITNSGNGIGVRGHSNSFQGIGVRGSRTNSGGPDTGWGGLFLNDLGYTGGLYNASDSRLKKNIQPINNATSILKQLNPVTYFYDVEKYNSLGFNEDLEYGLIAQEVKEILPTLVKEKSLFIKSKSGVSQLNTTEEGTSQNFLMIDYSRLTPILIQAVKEQQEIIESQENRIAKLEALVNQLINKK